MSAEFCFHASKIYHTCTIKFWWYRNPNLKRDIQKEIFYECGGSDGIVRDSWPLAKFCSKCQNNCELQNFAQLNTGDWVSHNSWASEWALAREFLSSFPPGGRKKVGKIFRHECAESPNSNFEAPSLCSSKLVE